jgi:hypothetical protein
MKCICCNNMAQHVNHKWWEERGSFFLFFLFSKQNILNSVHTPAARHEEVCNVFQRCLAKETIIARRLAGSREGAEFVPSLDICDFQDSFTSSPNWFFAFAYHLYPVSEHGHICCWGLMLGWGVENWKSVGEHDRC